MSTPPLSYAQLQMLYRIADGVLSQEPGRLEFSSGLADDGRPREARLRQDKL